MMDRDAKGPVPGKNGPGTLAGLAPGQHGVIERIDADIALKRRLSAMGFVKGAEVALAHTAPMGDPRAYILLGYSLSLRNEDACKIVLNTRD